MVLKMLEQVNPWRPRDWIRIESSTTLLTFLPFPASFTIWWLEQFRRMCRDHINVMSYQDIFSRHVFIE